MLASVISALALCSATHVDLEAPAAAAAPTAAVAPSASPPAAAPSSPQPVATPTPDAAAAPSSTPSADAAAHQWPADPPAPGTTAKPVTSEPVAASVPSKPVAKPVADPMAGYHLVPFDIGLVPGLSINGRHEGKRVRNKFSVAFGWTHATRVDGIAVGLGATIVDEHMHGISASLGANINRGVHRGIQFTHGYNYAADLRGVQHGAINRADAARGLQIGLVNIGGHVHGAQIGLVNWAKSADASFALLPITREGGIRFEVSSSDTALINAGIRLPARHTYAFAGAGLHPVGVDRGRIGPNLSRGKAWEFGGGFGGHIPVTDALFIDIDLSGWGVTSGLRAGAPLAGMTKLRAMVGWQAAPRVAIFAGPTFNAMIDRVQPDVVPLLDDEENERGPNLGEVERPGYGWVSYERVDRGLRLRMWPGFVAGVRF